MADKLKSIFEDDDLGLLKAPQGAKQQTSSDRLEASFLAIVDFYNEHGREPSPATTDISERKLGVGLRGIRIDDEKVELLKHLDSHDLLSAGTIPENIESIFEEDDDLGILDDPTGVLDVTNVPRKIESAEYKAQQRKSEDFENFEGMFKEMHSLIRKEEYVLINFEGEQSIFPGDFYVLKGLLVYVADKSALEVNKNGKKDARLRLIYENGTESDVLMRTLARELYRNGARITRNDIEEFESDSQAGYIYVLKSLSDDPRVANIRDLYKIGFSSASVETRVSNATNDPTYLMAGVEIIASYKTFNMNTHKFESLLHRVFNGARLNIEMTAKDGSRYVPSEWFVVPLDVIDMAIRMIISGDIIGYYYDVNSKQLEMSV